MPIEKFVNECDVCERRCNERKSDTYVILKDGTLEGITHCFTCKPLSLPRVERYADDGDVYLA